MQIEMFLVTVGAAVILSLIVGGLIIAVIRRWQIALQMLLSLLIILHPLLWYFLYMIWFQEYHPIPFVLSGVFSLLFIGEALLKLEK